MVLMRSKALTAWYDMGRHCKRLGALLGSAANMPGKCTTNSIRAPIVPISANGRRPWCERPPGQTEPAPVFHVTCEGHRGGAGTPIRSKNSHPGCARGWRTRPSPTRRQACCPPQPPDAPPREGGTGSGVAMGASVRLWQGRVVHGLQRFVCGISLHRATWERINLCALPAVIFLDQGNEGHRRHHRAVPLRYSVGMLLHTASRECVHALSCEVRCCSPHNFPSWQSPAYHLRYLHEPPQCHGFCQTGPRR